MGTGLLQRAEVPNSAEISTYTDSCENTDADELEGRTHQIERGLWACTPIPVSDPQVFSVQGFKSCIHAL